MTRNPTLSLETRLNRLETAVEDGDVSPEVQSDIQEFVNAYNPDYMLANPPGDKSTTSKQTLATYVSKFQYAAERISLRDATADSVNEMVQDLLDEGYSEHTIYSYQVALRSFFRFHDYGPDPEDITIINPDGNSISPDDMLNREEIQAMLDAATNSRDRAVFALLIYTGMRNAALRSLRVGDVSIEQGTWQFNDDAEGLKNATEYGKKRPLLAAKGPVREWLNDHPASDDPEAYLLTGLPDYGKAHPYSEMAQSTIGRITDKLAERADIDKPTNPHALRHNFVTLAKGEYELPDETVKFLIGHSPRSRVMETTYQHIGDDKHIERAEVGAGLRQPTTDSESSLTPQACPTCGEIPEPSAKACAKCGTLFTPDAAAAQEKIDDQIHDSAKQSDPDSDETDDLDKLREIVRRNPEKAVDAILDATDD